MRTANRALAAGLVVFVAGVVRDLRWHATHNTQAEFETASKQIEVHWILWLGTLVVLVACWLALSRSEAGASTRAYLLTFVSALVFAVVSVWHFIEHANGSDPELAHLFLYAASTGIVAGGILALMVATVRKPHRATQSGSVPGPRP